MIPSQPPPANQPLAEPLLTPLLERQMSMLFELTRAVMDASDIRTTLHSVIRPIATAAGWCYGEAWLPHERLGVLRSASVWYDNAALTAFSVASGKLRFAPGAEILGSVWQSRRTEWIPDIAAIDPAFALPPEPVLAAGLHSGLFLPIVAQDRVLAILVFFAREVRPVNLPMLRLIDMVATQIGAAIQRLQAQESLRAREALLCSVTDSALLAIVATNVERHILTWNPAAERIFGCPIAAALGQPFDFFIPERYRYSLALTIKHYKDLRHAGIVGQTIEICGLRRDGTEFPCEISLSPWDAAEGTCFTVIVRDITEQKQNEAELRALNSDLEARVAERTAQYLQTNATLLATKDQLRQTNEELEQRVVERTTALEEANRRLQQESAERTEAELQLRASEERFRQITEHISEVFYITDLASQRVLYISPSYEQIWGRSRASLYADNTSFVAAIHQDDHDKVIAALTRQARGETTEEIYRVLACDGQQRWVRDRAFPVYSPHGHLYRVVGIAEDISEQRIAEQQIRRANESLERRVIERTAALSEANSELERAARMKDEFLATMSHELRTPLNTILTLTEAVIEGVYGPLTQRQHHTLDAVTESGQHLLALINDILDVTKIESGKVKLDLDSVDVEGICTASLRMVRQIAHTKQQQITISLDSSVDTVLADPRRLKQILVNLLSNAIKFTPVGGRISLEVLGDRDADVLHFTVEDTGIGIPAADIHRLFKPFVQLDSRLSRHHEGTGLGLVLVAHLAELHGGGVSLTSTPGKGSRFTVSLPWCEDVPQTADSPPATHAAGGPSADERPVILLAEDNDLARHTTSDYLNARGYDVRTAHNGVEALAMVRELLPETILMDIQMPVMDGIEAIRQIRADQALGALPIIALTALAMVGDRERCLSAGADDYLSKPVKLSHLVERIEALRRGPNVKIADSR